MQGLRFAVALALATAAACKDADPAPRPEPSSPSGSTQPSERPFPPADGSVPIISTRAVSLELNPADDTLSPTLWRTGEWEAVQTGLILDRLAPGDTFVDVGANLGWYTVLASQRVGASGRVFAFEPDPESFALLRRNVERNTAADVVLVDKAAGAENGLLRLYLNTANRGDHRSYDPGGGRPYVDVAVIRLDDYFTGVAGPIRLIKIDTRGAECSILAGMSATLAAHRETALVVAYYPGFLEAMGDDPRACFGALVQAGFAMQWIREDTGTSEPIGLDALVARRDDGTLLLPARTP